MAEGGGDRNARGDAVEHQQGGQQKTAADPEQAGQKTDAETHAQDHQPLDRHLGDGQVNFHSARANRVVGNMRAGRRPCNINVSIDYFGRSLISGGTLAARLRAAAWKAAAAFWAAARSVSDNWVCRTDRRCLDSASPTAAAMAYHL